MRQSLDVLVDMDGVLADFEKGVEEQFLAAHAVDLAGSRGDKYIQDAHPNFRDQILAIPDQPHFFRNLPPVEGAIEGMQKIAELGYTPRICSALFTSNPLCESEKRIWLTTHLAPILGETVVEEAIFTSSKADYDGIALIDDKAIIRNAANARWQHIIFRQNYNRSTESLWAIENWQDDILPVLLEQAAHQHGAKS